MDNSIFAFSATEIGYNHLKNNKICEDASGSYDNGDLHVAVIADGHGSDNYPRTDRGARFAVDSAIRCIVEFVENADPDQVVVDERHAYALLTQLAKSILREWYQAVEEDYCNNPFEEKELEKVSEKYKKRYLAEQESDRRVEKAYGCTLIAYAITKNYSFGLQIGDGKCVLIDRMGNFTEPIPWDEECQMNVTTSICDSDAIDEFRFHVSEFAPSAVFCGSDGIDDSYANPEEMYALYRSIIKIFIEHGIEVGENEIKEYLPVLTKRGSGDDVSVATVIDLRRITELSEIFELQAERFNLSASCDQKNRKRVVSKEKMDSLYRRIQDSAWKDPKRQENVQEFNDLLNSYHQLNDEIEMDEQRLKEITLQYQNKLHGLEVETADVKIKNADSGMADYLELIGAEFEENTVTIDIGKGEKNTIDKHDSVQTDTASEISAEKEVASAADRTVLPQETNEQSLLEGTGTKVVVADDSAADEGKTLDDPFEKETEDVTDINGGTGEEA